MESRNLQCETVLTLPGLSFHWAVHHPPSPASKCCSPIKIQLFETLAATKGMGQNPRLEGALESHSTRWKLRPEGPVASLLTPSPAHHQKGGKNVRARPLPSSRPSLSCKSTKLFSILLKIFFKKVKQNKTVL